MLVTEEWSQYVALTHGKKLRTRRGTFVATGRSTQAVIDNAHEIARQFGGSMGSIAVFLAVGEFDVEAVGAESLDGTSVVDASVSECSAEIVVEAVVKP